MQEKSPLFLLGKANTVKRDYFLETKNSTGYYSTILSHGGTR
jgi:hypothetical protein